VAAYYNEHDERAAAWLRELITAGVIADGEVDQRSIADVRPDDLRGFVQCHFFAGIGGWSYALRLSEWPDDREAWSGSCPCQKHSSATRGRAVARDWAPEFCDLIEACRPRVVFGEQVATADAWLDGICDRLETVDYTIISAVLPAYSAGFDHARERIYFACDTNRKSESGGAFNGEVARMPRPRCHSGDVVPTYGVPGDMALMRAFGNAIVPQLAAEFIKSYCDVRGLRQ